MRKDDRYEWRYEAAPRLTDPSLAVFAVDDSEVVIRGSRHLLLAALGFPKPAVAVDRLAKLRRDLSLPADFEFKWNQKGLARSERDRAADGLREIIADGFGLLTVLEGTDRQHAAESLAVQVTDLCSEPVVPLLVFDEGIVTDPSSFRAFMLGSGYERLTRTQFCSARASAHDLIQCADVFVGFLNLKIRLALADATNRIVSGDFDGDEISLSDLLEVSFRYTLWGRVAKKVDPSWTNKEYPPPDWIFKEAEGFGMRIHSSLDTDTQALLYDEVGRPYFGCWH